MQENQIQKIDHARKDLILVLITNNREVAFPPFFR
jgi:hypothetical protein